MTHFHPASINKTKTQGCFYILLGQCYRRLYNFYGQYLNLFNPNKMLFLCLIITIITALISINLADVNNCDKLGTLLYEDLNCKPKLDGHLSCPVGYVCDNFELSNDTCLFQSRKLPVGEVLDNNLTYSGCQVGCRCEINDSTKKAGIQCAVLDCPEWLGDYGNDQNCRQTYKLGECCASGQNCGKFNNETKICQVNGTNYREGERFSPENTCFECVCTKDFTDDGIYDGKAYCQKQKCVVQTISFEQLSKNCAPYYREEIKCCPSTWICPSKSDQIVKSNATTNSDLSCKFGDVGLKVGDKVEVTTEIWDEMISVTCECLLPPFLICTNSDKIGKIN